MIKTYTYPAVLTIAGSDSGGGAGIQADLKTFSALGCYGTSAITAITVQNTLGVTAIHSIPPDIVQGQISAVMDDIRPSAIKIGMVHSTELARAISLTLAAYPEVPLIFDPVMVATSGDALIQQETVGILKTVLFPLMTLVTPNLDEAELLLQRKISNVEQMQEAAMMLLATGCKAVLLKGGHLKGEHLFDVYADQQGTTQIYTSAYIESENVHGTGCTLSSAIAAFMALRFPLHDAIRLARDYVHAAILHGAAVKTGEGHGPLNHFFNPQKLQLHEME